MTLLELHPDRALPLHPEQRRIAKEIYGETKGLPLICMHGHVDAQVFADDVPFADPAQLLIVPDHYVFRMLASQGIDIADLGCRGPTAVRSNRTPGRSGGPSARTGSSTAAPRRATGWSTNWSRSSGSTWCRAPRRPTPSMTRSPPGSPSPSSARARCWTGSTSRSSRPPTPLPRELRAARETRRRRPGRAGAAHLPARRPGVPRPPDLAGRDRRAGDGVGHRHGDVRRVPGCTASASRGLRRGGRAGHRPRPPAGRHHPDGRRCGPRASTRGSSTEPTRPRPRSSRSPPTCSSRWPRWPARTAW